MARLELRPTTEHRRTELVTWILIVVVATGDLLYIRQAVSYSVGTPATPGAGMFPTIVGILLLFGLAGVALEVVLHGHGARERRWDVAATLRAVALIGICVVYVIALPHADDVIPGAVLMLAILLVMGRRPLAAIVISAAIAVAFHLLFVTGLGVPLTQGAPLW